MTNLMKMILLSLTVAILSACGQKTSEEHVMQARQYMAEDNPDAAILELKNAVQINPKSGMARFELGQLYLAEKDFESAEKELNRALEYDYDAAKVLPLLARAYQRTGAHSALSKLNYEEAMLSPTKQAEVGYFKLLSLVRLDKEVEAGLLISEIASLDTSSIYKGLSLAYENVLAKEYDLAFEQLEALQAQSPENGEMLKLLGQLHLTRRQPEAAAKVFAEYVHHHPDDFQTTFVLAKLLVDIGQMAEAEPFLDTLLKVNPQNGLLNQLKSATRMAVNDYPNAQLFGETAIQNGVSDVSVRLIAGFAAYQQQDFSNANRHLSFIASLLPDNHPGLKLLAASQLELGLNSEVGDVLGRLDQLTEQDAQLFSKASYELLRSGYVNEAQQLIEKSSSISRTAEDLTRLGLLQLSLNNLEGIVNLEQALEKSPKLSSAKNTLSTAYIATEQYEKAHELAAKWKNADGQDIQAYMLAGEVYFKQENYAAAKQEFEQALVVDKDHSMASLALINLDVIQGNYLEANTQLNVLLKAKPTFMPALATFYLIAKEGGIAEQGIQRIKQAQDSNPDDMVLRMLLARIYNAEQQYPESLALLEELNGQKSLPVSYWKLRGQGLIRTNQRERANEHYDAWLLNAPLNKEATTGKLLLLESENEFADGLALTQAFLDKRDDLQMQLLETHFLLLSADYPAARKAYDALPDTSLKLPIVKGFLARLQLVDKNPQDALGNARIAYQAVSSNRNLHLLLYAYEMLGQKKQGQALLEKHLKVQPKDISAWMLLAERQISQDKRAAMNSYERALLQNPENYIARNNLAFLYLENGDIDKAKEHALVAVSLKPNSAESLDTLAQILVAQQNYDEAIRNYELAVGKDKDNEEIYLNYVETLFAADRLFLAKRKLQGREFSSKSTSRVAEIKAKYSVE